MELALLQIALVSPITEEVPVQMKAGDFHHVLNFAKQVHDFTLWCRT